LFTSKNGRAISGVPLGPDAMLKRDERGDREKKLPSIAIGLQVSNQ